MLALYREAHKKKSDVMALNKIARTQKNCQCEMFKSYKEHLHQLAPMPFFSKHAYVGTSEFTVCDGQTVLASMVNLTAGLPQRLIINGGCSWNQVRRLTMRLPRPLALSESTVAGDLDLGLMMPTQVYHGLVCAAADCQRTTGLVDCERTSGGV